MSPRLKQCHDLELLHCEDVYERESPCAGEADIIVAKHRNGPTSDVVSFHGHHSRFVDMARWGRLCLALIQPFSRNA